MNRYDTWHMNKHISKLNTKIRKLLETFPSVKIIATKTLFRPSDYCQDGVHLNQTGQRKLFEKLKSSLKLDCLSNNEVTLTQKKEQHLATPKFRNKNRNSNYRGTKSTSYVTSQNFSHSVNDTYYNSRYFKQQKLNQIPIGSTGKGMQGQL